MECNIIFFNDIKFTKRTFTEKALICKGTNMDIPSECARKLESLSKPENENCKVELCELPGQFYKNLLIKVLENKVKLSLKNYDLKISPGIEKGKNFLGVLYRVVAVDPDCGEEGKFQIMVKLPPQDPDLREQLKIRMSFLRESMFYDVVLPMFKKFQEEKGCNVTKEGFYEVPEVLALSIEEPNEAFFMEDLTCSGYEICHRSEHVTCDHVNLVMRVLAKMHAIAFSIKDQKPELMEQFKNMPEYFINEDQESRKRAETWYKNLRNEMAASVADHANQNLKKRVEIFLQDDFTTFCSSIFDEKYSEPYAVLTHGDCKIFDSTTLWFSFELSSHDFSRLHQKYDVS